MPLFIPHQLNRPVNTGGLLAFVSLIVASLLTACGGDAPLASKKSTEPPLSVQILTITPRAWRSNFDSYGYLESTETVNISIDFSGTVSDVKFKDGQTINAGQVLIELDRKKQALKLRQAEASLISVKAELEKAHG